MEKEKDNKKPPDSYTDYRDIDWVKLIKKQIDVPKNDSEQPLILEQKNVVCMYPELVKEFAKDRPGFWRDYAETMYTVEEVGIRKKYWKMVKTLI